MKTFATGIALALSLAAASVATPSLAAPDTTALMTTVPGDNLTVSDVYKQNVYDPQDNKIGDVSDVLLDKSGKVTAVIVGVGGFLGVGEKDIAVPFTALSFAEKDGKRYLVMNATKEALQTAPGYIYDREHNQWVPAKRAS